MIDVRTLKKLFLILSFASVQCIPPPKQNCECSLFLKDELWIPRYLVMSLTNDYEVDCTDFGKASDNCKSYCSDELAVLNSLYEKDSSILDGYPPSQTLPCNFMPRDSISFSKVCGSQTYVLSTRESGPPVCCDSSEEKRIWCGTSIVVEEAIFHDDNIVEGRKLDLRKDQNDESHNEIEGSSVASDDKPSKTKLIPHLISPGTKSWVQTILTFFGYNGVGQLIKDIDIFSFPSKVQSAIRTYKDEVSMGRCYMEFTTFKVFTKQENPFEDLLRKRRNVYYMGPVTRFDENIDDLEYEFDDIRSISSENKKATHADSIKKVVGGLADILERSDSTKQYAHLLSSFLPLITQITSGVGGGTSSGFPVSTLLKFVGPLLSQMGSSRPASVNSMGAFDTHSRPPISKKPLRLSTPASSASSSPFTSMIMNMVGNVISNFFSSPGAQNKIETPAPTTTRPTKPAASAPPAFDFTSSGIGTLIKLFLQSASSTPPVARPIETPKPVTKPVTVKVKDVEEKKDLHFIDMLLELIRPVFISIIGNAPGENGVKEIRRVSTLSTLGRVDDTLREEVDSPFFCFKKYMVNKAWSITENGVRTIVSKFTPEEQARMMERMLA